MIIVRLLSPEPFWLVGTTKVYSGPGSRHCHGINFTHPMREDVKRKHFSTPLRETSNRCLHHGDYNRFLVHVHADILDVATHSVASLGERSFALHGVFPSR